MRNEEDYSHINSCFFFCISVISAISSSQNVYASAPSDDSNGGHADYVDVIQRPNEGSSQIEEESGLIDTNKEGNNETYNVQTRLGDEVDGERDGDEKLNSRVMADTGNPISDFLCFDIFGWKINCFDLIDFKNGELHDGWGGGGSSGGGGAGRSWDNDTCYNSSFQEVDCLENNGICRDFVVDDSGILPVNKLVEVPCTYEPPPTFTCFDVYGIKVPCGGEGRLCNMHVSGSQYGDAGVYEKVFCRDVVTCYNWEYFYFDDVLEPIDCDTPTLNNNSVVICTSPNEPEWRDKCQGRAAEWPRSHNSPIQYTDPRLGTSCSERLPVGGPVVGNKAQGYPCFLEPADLRACYDINGNKVDCNTRKLLKNPNDPAPGECDDGNTGPMFVRPMSIMENDPCDEKPKPELPEFDCDICSFLSNCQLFLYDLLMVSENIDSSLRILRMDFQSFTGDFNHLIGEIIAQSGKTNAAYLKIFAYFEKILVALTGQAPPVDPENPDIPIPETTDLAEIIKYLKEIAKNIEDLKMEIVEEAGTNFWDFLGGLFGDIFELIEFIIEKIIYLVVPENGDFITDSFAGLSGALNKKFEPMDALKSSITGSLMVEQKNFEDVTLSLPIYGSTKVLDTHFLNMAIPKIRALLSGIMIIITSIWAYRKVSSGMIK